ncbi:LLM class flavin-dependent oxidoreductase [Halanaeroarchaeum sp. HSR-CO]|uniref:LLM class flavin-dependent oxidoreductase n=1 Tax=Halanaeroarchaeum sp. HSR-CO TaxID=2866382 RepID=UPI00217EBA3D|nr:LLM class flavin-dependent oxidoreductase [Halanaeroarchaeum sp. HSR-CO]UWG48399.1 LLM class flavin-dependent oxidoreductase [Halanaeroarchaeum sp. HSR-CO]
MPKFGYLLPTREIVLSSENETSLTAKTETEVIGLARRAEALGIDGVWVGDSVLAKPRLEPLSTLAAIASVTDAVDLGTAVYLPTLRNPVHVAHLTATIDQISGGRLGLGIGVGIGADVQREYENLGIDFDTRGARMDELLEIVNGLWEGDPVSFAGEFFDLEQASIGFGPTRKPPIYIPTAAFDPSEGFPISIRDRLLSYGDGWLPIGVSPPAYEASLDRIHSLLREADRNPDSFEPAVYLDMVISETEADALEEVRSFYERYYPERDRLTDEAIQARGAFGPPEDVANTIDAYEDAGVENVIVRFTTRDQRTQLRRFADVVRCGSSRY